jgi:hypothetical protein
MFQKKINIGNDPQGSYYYEVARGVPDSPDVNRLPWQADLAVVETARGRYVGLIPGLGALEPGDTFTMLGAMPYIVEIEYQQMLRAAPGPEGKPIPARDANGQLIVDGVRANTKVHVMIPYDLLGPVSIQFSNYSYVIKIKNQPETVRAWFENEYLGHYDPPMLTPALKGV